MSQVTTRRDRMRAATVREITETARRILVAQGPDAVTLRAIAREMGMTAPALYRYFESHQDLLGHLVAEFFSELTEQVEAAIAAVDELKMKFGCAAQVFRAWSLAHPREYSLLFGTPIPPPAGAEATAPETIPHLASQCSLRFGAVWAELFLELWRRRPFPVPSDDEIEPDLRVQIVDYRAALGLPELPLGSIVVFLSMWIRLQGFVTLEVFGHLKFALTDSEPMFHLLLHDLADRLGLDLTL